MSIVNDYILNHSRYTDYGCLNVDKEPITFFEDGKGVITIKKEVEINGFDCTARKDYTRKETRTFNYIIHNRRDPISLTNLLLDRFDRKHAVLQQPFSYQIMKPILDKLKETYPDCKVYCDLKRIYTKEDKQISSARLEIFHNKTKKTLNVTLHA